MHVSAVKVWKHLYEDRVKRNEPSEAFTCPLGRRWKPEQYYQKTWLSDKRTETDITNEGYKVQGIIIIFNFLLFYFFTFETLFYNGEFDPGSGWTLATGLTHASRGETGKQLAAFCRRPAHGWVTRIQPSHN